MTSPDTSHTGQIGHSTHDDHDDFGGMARDIAMDRRRLLSMFATAGASALVFAACGGDDKGSTGNTAGGTTAGTTGSTSAASDTTAATASSTSAADASAECSTTIPNETGGPYPGDGSNGPDVLGMDGVVRQDIRTSIGGASGTAEGIPLQLTFQVLDTANGCAAYGGAAVYAWHCTADGRYSMYSDGLTEENFLRGVQVADADGNVTFTSIFPGCYRGRWPHIHFEVYNSVDDALAAANIVKTSQLAMPEDACNEAYTASGYEASGPNLSGVSLATDNVFSDGVDDQLATVTGDPDSGYTATLVVRV